jgi:Family of unknown function (DUF5670)
VAHKLKANSSGLLKPYALNLYGVIEMLETIIIVLLVLWLVGMVSGQSLGGMLWMLLVVAAVLFVVRLLSGRRAV